MKGWEWICSSMHLGLVRWGVVKCGSGPELLWIFWGRRKRADGTCSCVHGMGGGGRWATAVSVNWFGLDT